MNLPECSKQNISKMYSVFSKKNVFIKFPLFSHSISVISEKRSSFSGLTEYFKICPDMFQICPDNFQTEVHMSAPLNSYAYVLNREEFGVNSAVDKHIKISVEIRISAEIQKFKI